MSSSANERIYEWQAPAWNWQTVVIDGRTCLRPDSSAGLLRSVPGEPLLPMAVLALDLLPGQTAEISLVDTLFTFRTLTQPLCPAPALDPATGGWIYAFPPPQFLPGDIPAMLCENTIGQARDRRILRISLFPVQYKPHQQALRLLQYARLRVNILQPQPVLLRPAAAPESLPASCLKIFLVDEGPYQITASALEAAGISPGSLNPEKLRLFNKGIEQPIQIAGGEDGRFDPTDRILFYGRFRHGEEEFFDAYSDTNVYWLTWDGAGGARFNETTATLSGSALEAFPDTLHFEKDLYYYAGDSDNDIHNSEQVPGEGWVWVLLNKGGSADLPFELFNPAGSQDSLLLRMRVRGTTLDAHSPDHHIQLLINDAMIHETWFEDRTELHLAFRVAATRFHSGVNILKIRLLADTPSERSQIYVDWFEIGYQRLPVATGDRLLLKPLSAKAVTVTATGFVDSTLIAWDLSRQRRYHLIQPGRAWQEHLTVRSAGMVDGKQAKLLRDGVEVSSGTRGHNFWRIDPQTGLLLEKKNFDTYGSRTQADSMAAWVQRLPAGAVVAGAISDDGSVNMTESAHLALESLGSARTRSVGYRDCWAIIGRKGAPVGSVSEVWRKSGSGPAVIDTIMAYRSGSATFSARLALPADAGNEIAFFTDTGVRSPCRIAWHRSADLIGGGEGADYLIITHPAFKVAAERLAAYRAAHNSWRIRVALVDQIFDEFNHGLADPQAIRTFLRHARENWRKPAPGYVLLLGDASWDPKNLYGLAHPTEYVPTYGNPVSDSWLACLDGKGDILPDLRVGRIPAQTTEEAEACISKIIAYEAAPSAQWKKNFLFISGGFDFLEQNQFSLQSDALIKTFILPAPTCGLATSLHKTTSSTQEGEHRQDILDTIDAGVVWVNFIGHAGSKTWDLMFHNTDIEALSNGPQYPFITSMTCHTGRFAEPNQVAFGEHFLMVENKGAIGFMGTSGWGYSYEDYTFLSRLFPAALTDTLRALAEIIDKAKVKLWEEGADNSQITNMIYQYNLLGDPALRLGLPVAPDLAVEPGDIEVLPEIPNEADSTAQITVRINNWGLATRDSIGVRLTVRQSNGGEQVLLPLAKRPAIGRIDSITCNWPLRNMAGAVELIAQVDPMAAIAESDEGNNLAKRSITVTSRRLQVNSPPPFALIPRDRLVFKVWEMDRNAAPRSVEFAVDTSQAFHSPMLQTSGRLTMNQMAVSWSPQPLTPQLVYHWRCRDLADTESEHPILGEFYLDPASQWGWRQVRAFSGSTSQHLDLIPEAVLDTLQYLLLAASGGANDGNFAGIYLNGENIVAAPGRGYSVVVLDPATITVRDIRKFDLYGNAAAVAEMAVFLSSVPTGMYVLTAVKDEGSFSSPALIAAFESLGSLACRNVHFRDSWAMIGVKGAEPGSARELLRPSGGGEAAVSDTLSCLAPSGTLTSPRIGPAAAWRSVRAEAEVPQTGDLTLSLLGQRRNSSVWDTLRTGLAANHDHDITAISAHAFPYLQLSARFSSRDQQHSPRLSAWQVLHDPVPDLAVSPAFLSLSADSVLSGRPVVIKFSVFNIGLATTDSVSLTFTETAPGSGEKLFSHVMLPKPLAADQNVTVDQLYTPSGKPGSRLLTIRVDGDNAINELSESNNTLTARVQVVADTLKPEIAVTFDGRTIAAGDWISARPVILARLIDDSPLTPGDTLRVNLLLDGERVSFSDRRILQLLTSPDTTAAALLKFTPQLSEGEHHLEILFADGSGNLASASAEFGVASSIQLQRVMNYPNPLRESTDFTFELTRAAEVRIRIYTVNGRLIRILEGGSLGAGFNRLFWDGRDDDGDPLANGVYLYRIDAVSDKDRTQVIEKCIVMR
ncbi:MAG TPA: C25 family cysteine peptidase [bacterium]|nr:C25 family cysteine peptidase [bacterium]HQJ64209.1 C25 family cysteine peptidase [bacterium]